MLKTVVWLFYLYFLCLLGLSGAGQESIELLNLYDTTPEVIQAFSHSGHPVAVSVNVKDLNEISGSVLMAESWLRTHVLAHFPATKITTVVVGDTILCQRDQEHKLGLVLPSLKNIYYSLTRWGLEREIKVSAAFSSDCLRPHSAFFRNDLVNKVVKLLLQFLQSKNSTYSVNPPPNFSPLSYESVSLLSSHSESMKKLGFFELNKINVIIPIPKDRKPMGRKLSFVDSKLVDPFPARPTPLPEIPPSSFHSSIGYSVPANVARNPLPPQSHTTSPPPLSFSADSPPPMSFPFAPELPPAIIPATPPFGFSWPPCRPAETIAPTPVTGVMQRLWCVAKPNVPADTLQEAIDYACGEGGADCEEITPHGSCFHPDTVVAHASYAFNSYWQKTKKNGGTCSFGGTAMIINADPSFLHCRFVLS